MSQPLTVRAFAPGEAMTLRTIRREALASEPHAYSSSLVEEWDMPDERLESWLVHNLIVGAFAGREAVGMAGLRRLTHHKVAHRAELWGLFLRPVWRGSGAADRLMEAVLELCDRAIRQIELNVTAENPAALAFYRRHGFRGTGRISRAALTEGGYVDEIVMLRWLDRDEGQ